ncbi:hypothetical protein ABLE93_11415 [Xanthobacter sp. KR7-65]|uniref:hypothetical protein n=1 Tax=Xanthobacter sp. KR7-65 TaxID=3156612 RepID=UPI0032B4B041
MMRPATMLRRLTLAPDARAGGWRVAREEGPDPAAALIGLTPEAAARLAPLVFNLCGAAHAFAARSALGLPAAADAEAKGREMARETVRDHALALLHTLPVALGMAPDRAALGLLAQADTGAFHAALVGDGSDLAAFTPAELDAWLAEAPTATACVLALIRRDADPAEGRADLPELSAETLAATLARPAAAIGSHRETGALGRVAATPLLSALLASEGPSLFVRLLARLADCLAHLTPRPAPALPAGIAPAARGLLGHRADVVEGRVAAYRILSPSAWNLAPGGLLERGFAALSPGARTRWLAPLLVCAINPCVPVTLSFATEPAYA